MHDIIHPRRPTRLPRARLLAIATLVGGALVAGCGGSSGRPTATAVGSATAATSSATRSTSSATGSRSSPTPAQYQRDEVAFARCMRSHGAPDFPDPQPGGGFSVHIPLSAGPAFQAAQAKCQKLLPNAGAGPAFSERALVQLRKLAVCMRQHRVPDFPDPRKAPPSGLPSPSQASPSKYSRIADYRGVLLEFPAALDTYSPAFEQALAACGGAFLNQPG